MSTVAKIALPAEEFALHETLEAVPNVEFKTERIIARKSDQVMPFIWATSEEADHKTVTKALTDDSSTRNVLELATFENEWFYQMEWVERIEVVLYILLEHNATVLNADGRNDEWHLRVLFPKRENLSKTYDFCQEEGLSIDLVEVYELDNEHRDLYGLTDIQHETLVTAVEQGYFKIPQQTTLDDLAAELDITHQALSERLHRGHEALIKNALIIGRIGD